MGIKGGVVIEDLLGEAGQCRKAPSGPSSESSCLSARKARQKKRRESPFNVLPRIEPGPKKRHSPPFFTLPILGGGQHQHARDADVILAACEHDRRPGDHVIVRLAWPWNNLRVHGFISAPGDHPHGDAKIFNQLLPHLLPPVFIRRTARPRDDRWPRSCRSRRSQSRRPTS